MSASIQYTIASEKEYYFDLLENGKYMVSYFDTRLKVFPKEKANEAIFFYLSKIIDIDSILDGNVSDSEVDKYLLEQLKNNH